MIYPRICAWPTSPAGSKVWNDSGIVFLERRPYVICVMTTYLANERRGEDAIASISAAAYRMFDRLARASEYGRMMSPSSSGSH